MAAGIRVIGQHGVTQIDGDYSNFGLTQSGTLSLTPGTVFGFQSPMVVGTITVIGTAPVVAINGSGVFINEYASVQSGNQWTFYFRAASSQTISVGYWVFDTANRAIGASAPEGFRINDQFGVTVCHGGMDPMKVVDFINLGAPPDGWNGTSQENQFGTSRTYTAGRTYAVIQAAFCRRQEDYTAANQFDYPNVQPGNQMVERRILYSASRSSGAFFEFALATGEARIQESPLSNPNTGYTNGSLAWWVVDVSGIGSAPPVNDVTPNALNWSNISFSTTADYGIGFTNTLTIAGLVQPITLRVSVTGITETFNDGYVYAVKNGATQATPNRHWTQAGAGSFLVTVQNGDTLAFCADGTTLSGRRTGTATVTITNESDGSTVLDTFTISGEVDSSNTFNILDLTPNPISVPNLTGYVSNDPELYTDGRFFQITGINGQIWLRFIRTYHELVQTGQINTRRLLIFHSTVGSGGPWTPYFVGAGTPENPVPYTDVACQNGDWFYVQGWITTVAGRGTASWRNYIDWHDGITVLGRLATFDVSGTVDADDTFYADDYDLNPVAWGNQGGNFYEPIAAWATEYQTLTGINRQIVIRADLFNMQGVNGFPMGDGGNFYIISEQRGNLTSIPWRNGGSAYATVNPGERIRFYTDVYTSSGRKDTYFDVNVYNHTTGAFLDHHYSVGIVDLGNTHNLADYVPDAIAFPAISAFQPEADPVMNTSGVYTLTGFNQPITMRCYMGLTYYSALANASTDPFEPNMQPTSGICTTFVFRNGAVAGNTPHFTFGGSWSGQEYYQAFDFTAYPGDTIQFQTHYHIDANIGTARSGAIVGNIYLDSLSGGNRLGQFGHDSTFSTS